MQFTIDTAIFNILPTLKVGVIIATGLQTPDNLDFITDLKKDAVESAADAKNLAKIQSWQAAFQAIGLDPQETKPSIIALQDRVTKSGSLPTILPLVDVANCLSLKYGLPIGTHTIDSLDSIEVRPAKSDDSFLAMNQLLPESVERGSFIYASGNKVLTKNLAWRQGETSKIRPETRNVLISFDTFETTPESELVEIISEFKAILETKFGAQVESGIVTAANPRFSTQVTGTSVTTGIDPINEVLTRGVAEILPNKNSLAKLMSERPIKLYLGIDPTGAFLTLGHSVVLRKLQQFANLGHEVILLIGNGTVRIGDPTGRDTTRPVLTDEQIEANFKDWQSQASKILDFSKIKLMHNGDWLDKLTYADLVKLMAQTTVQQLIERDMFQTRIKNGQPIFGHEIMYPLLQGYDSVAMNVDLELGGTDQTFNMMMGRTLQKIYNNHEKLVLTTPIINGTDGRKMSKSFGNYVALTDEPSDMYGKLMSISDDMIVQYFTVLTDEPMDAIGDMDQAMKNGENPMQFKKQLAWTITKMYHTAEAANQAQANFESGVQNKTLPEDAQVIEVSASEVSTMTILNLLQKCLPEESSSNLRRLVEQGAVELLPANFKPSDPFAKIGNQKFDSLRVGKRRFFKLKKM